MMQQTPPMPVPPQGDQRSEPRIHSEITIFVETFSAPAGEARPSSIVISKTLDISAHGLQVVMDTPINLGSILQLCVDFGARNERYNLIGEVRWVSKTRFNEHYLVGFHLMESEQCHIDNWQRVVELLAQQKGIGLE